MVMALEDEYEIEIPTEDLEQIATVGDVVFPGDNLGHFVCIWTGAKDIDSRVTGRTTGHPVRALRNEMTKKYIELENEGAGFEELEK